MRDFVRVSSIVIVGMISQTKKLSRWIVISCLAAIVLGSLCDRAEAKIVRSVVVGGSVAGRQYSVEASGLRPGMRVSPYILASPTKSCCGVGVRKSAAVSADGRVRFTFDWPRFYFRCAGHGEKCSRVRWRRRMKVRIGVSSPDMYRSAPPRRRHQRRHRPSRGNRRVSLRAELATTSAAGPVDPFDGGGISYQRCHSSWMSEAGTSGAGVSADVSFAPSNQARVLGRFFGDQIWADLQGCAPFPYLTGEEYESIYQQFVCHLEVGLVDEVHDVRSVTGDTYDFEAWRPTVPANASALHFCNPDLGPGGGIQYNEHIVQWAGDKNAQKSAWLVQKGPRGGLERRWIPSSQIYYCLKGRGVPGPVELDTSFLATYLKPEGHSVSQAEACGGPPSSSPPGGSSPLPAHEFRVMNAAGGIYWRSAPDWNTPVAVAGNGVYPDTIIKVTCYQAGAANVPGTSDGMWEQASWVSGGGSSSGWINEHFINDGAALGQPSPGTSQCPSSSSPPPPPQTWSEQETPNHPVNTFTNYHNASGMGPAIGAGQWVEVSCKVYDPTIASVNPDGYWYRIASSPWSNAYYSPANTFMNGDPYGGPYTHNTDFSVPNC